jgi:hypothetical protein
MARWATQEEAPYEVIFYNSNINIKKDYTTYEDINLGVKILKESGRERFVNYKIFYDAATENVDNVAVEVHNNGVILKIDPSMIERNKLATNIQGLSDLAEISIALGDVKIGSEIYIQYSSTKFKPSIPNFVSNIFSCFGEYYLKGTKVINSEIPLYFEVNDPRGVLAVKTDHPTMFRKATISIKKPIYEAVTGEAEFIADNKLTFFAISSEKSWEGLANKVSRRYQDVFNQDLPKSFERIRDKAAKIKDSTEQLNEVTSLLSETIQYMGDYRSVGGQMFPKDLSLIEANKIGDCKDFSAAAGAILRKLGYKAEPALVSRGVVHQPYSAELPTSQAFNHVFLKVTNKSGRIYWLDPTNFVSMAQDIFPDIANRDVLVLDAQSPSLEKTPSINYRKTGLNSKRVIELMDNNTAKIDSSVALFGLDAMVYTGINLIKSQQEIEDGFFFQIAGENLDLKNKISIKLPHLLSRIVKDLQVNCEYHVPNYLTKTNLGLGIGVHQINLFDFPQDQVSDLYIGKPITIKRTYILKNYRVPNIDRLNFNISSEWQNINTSWHYEGKDTKYEITEEIKKSIVLNQDLKRYKDFKDEIESRLITFAIISN